MTWVATAIIGGAVIGGAATYFSGKEASRAQRNAAEAGINATERQFEALRQLNSPYVQAGEQSLAAQQALAGLSGPEAQQTAVQSIATGSQFGELAKQGETGILQNASATGGLRGGNTQAALAQFRPALLSSLIEQQYQRLGGITSLGQNAAAGVGNAGMQSGANVAQLLQQQGAATAGGILSTGAAVGQLANIPAQGLGTYYGLTGKVPFGAGSTPWGTNPGSQQTAMLSAQQGGF